MKTSVLKKRGYPWIGAAAAVVTMLLFFGCSSFSTLSPKGSQNSGDSTVNQSRGNAPLYHDFKDVLIPGELKKDMDASFMIDTPGFSAGVLAFKGRVEINSLIAFFQNNMVKDNWRPISALKSTRTMMLYQKDNRWCVIKINEEEFNTHVEVWVAPSMAGSMAESDSGLLK